MATSIYIILSVLVIMSTVGFVVYIWAHMPMNALAAFGAGSLMFGLVLNFAALRHVGHSWGLLPSWIYTLPIYVGFFVLMIVSFVKLANVSQKVRESSDAVEDDKIAEAGIQKEY